MNTSRYIKHKKIYIIILLFLAIKLLIIPYYNVIWWDSAVYIGMGKYIYSLGNAGLWENSRPIVWPMILGFLWKIGLDRILIGRIIEIFFGSLCILFTYLIGRKIFDETTALLASLFLALSPTFFFFDGILLTEIVSTFFSLIAVYLVLQKKYFFSGLFFGMAFMARYLQLFAFITILLVLFFSKNNIKNLRRLIYGFIITVSPFLILNRILYNNALFPFFQQILLSRNSGWLNYHGMGYYFIGLFRENALYLLLILGVVVLFKSRKPGKIAAAAVFLVFFIFFNSIKQKEMRFLIILLPYMYLLVSCGITSVFGKIKNDLFKRIMWLLVILSFILSGAQTYNYFKSESMKIEPYKELQSRLDADYVKGKIGISSPIISVFSSKKINNLMYYPFFNEEKKNELESSRMDFIFLDTCDLACRPFDLSCEGNKKELLAYFKKRFAITHASKNAGCEQYVFQK